MSFCSGLSVDSWVQLSGSARLSCEVYGDEVQLKFGCEPAELQLVTTEDALEKLVRVATEALTRMRAIPEGEQVDFTVVG